MDKKTRQLINRFGRICREKGKYFDDVKAKQVFDMLPRDKQKEIVEKMENVVRRVRHGIE